MAAPPMRVNVERRAMSGRRRYGGDARLAGPGGAVLHHVERPEGDALDPARARTGRPTASTSSRRRRSGARRAPSPRAAARAESRLGTKCGPSSSWYSRSHQLRIRESPLGLEAAIERGARVRTQHREVRHRQLHLDARTRRSARRPPDRRCRSRRRSCPTRRCRARAACATVSLYSEGRFCFLPV